MPWIIEANRRSGADCKTERGDVTGVRTRIEPADPIINRDKFRFLAPVPIFKRGPHGAKFNWNANRRRPTTWRGCKRVRLAISGAGPGCPVSPGRWIIDGTA